MDESKRARYRKLIAQLEQERSSWIPHWRTLYEHTLPRMSRFLTSEANRGERKHQKIVDSTGTMAVRTLSSGMTSGLTSPSRPWYMLTLADKELAEWAPVKTWLHDATEAMRALHQRSNLYNILPIGYLDLGVAGTTGMTVMEDPVDGMRMYHHPVGSYMLSCNERGVVDCVARKMRKTVRQLISEFGEKNCSNKVRLAWKRGHLEEWVDVSHIVKPNEDYRADRLLAKHKRYASCWWEEGVEKGDTEFLRESGFDVFPFLGPRWFTTGEDVYGSSPCMDVLGDIQALQHMQRQKAKGVEKQVDPPMRGPLMLKNERVSLLPGEITYLDHQQSESFKAAHEVNIDLNGVVADIREHQARIREALFADLFKMMYYSDRRQMTATEVAERHEEKLLMLGPVLEKLDDELNGPLIENTWSIMQKQDLVPPAPEEIQGQPLKVEYISILAQAQKMLGISTLERFIGFAGSIAPFNPESLDKVDFDQALDEYGGMTGIPPRIIRSDDQVAARRQQRAADEAQMQQAALGAQQAETAKTLAETDTSGKNGLTDLLREVGAA